MRSVSAAANMSEPARCDVVGTPLNRFGLTHIGEAFGGRDIRRSLHAIRKMDSLLMTMPGSASGLRDQIRERFTTVRTLHLANATGSARYAIFFSFVESIPEISLPQRQRQQTFRAAMESACKCTPPSPRENVHRRRR